MNRLTIKDFAYQFLIPETTLRGWVARDELTISTEILKNRKTKVVLLDEKAAKKISEYKNVVTSSDELNNAVTNKNESRNEQVGLKEPRYEQVQEAEIISDMTQYQMVSMEQGSFDQLIKNIKDLSDDRAKSDNEAIKRIENEYFELKTNYKQLEQENKKLIIESAQFEAETKIKNLTITELENNISIKNDHNEKLQKKIKELEEKVTLLEKTQNDVKNNQNFWTKKL